MNGKRYSEEKTRKNGFYLALAVCLAAVGIAAWSTYDAVHSYVSREESSSAAPTPAATLAPSPAPGDDDEDPEKPRQTGGTVVIRAPESTSAPAKATPAPTATPRPKPAETPKPDPEPASEPLVPATAPLYELSREMIWPLAESSAVLKAYSSGAPVYSKTMRDWRIHTGTDMTAQPGEEVRACANGQVKETYTDSKWGNVIVVEHGEYVLSYCGVGEDFRVKPGDVVTKGQTIGTVTAIPCESADEPHLHLEARRDAAWVDPRTLFRTEE